MKSTVLLSLALSAFTAQALALPSDDTQPLLGEAKDSQQDVRPQDRHLAEGGADRLLAPLWLAEDGADRLLEQRHAG